MYAKACWASGSKRCISGVQAASAATGGPGGILGNKGGLVVKLNFGGTSLAFVSCHLAAHAPKLEKRNENCQEILEETTSQIGCKHLDVVSQFDHVFWMGDLNYRTDLNAAAALASPGTAPPYPEETAHHAAVLKLIEASDWEGLLAADQLGMCQQRGEAFVGFAEGRARFRPTFKVLRSPEVEYKDQRIPSYRDRVLWKSMPPLRAHLQQTSLTTLPGVSTSDHKPVRAPRQRRTRVTPRRQGARRSVRARTQRLPRGARRAAAAGARHL